MATSTDSIIGARVAPSTGEAVGAIRPSCPCGTSSPTSGEVPPSTHLRCWYRKYIFSVDHKMIGKQYMMTGLVMALVGGYLAYVFRHQLAWPNQPVPGFGNLAPDTYNAFVTMHGTIMVFWVAMPLLLSGFGNFLLPLMIGAEDMAFPRLNRMSYWTFVASTLILLTSFFVPGGAASGGWTSYPPLSDQPGYTGVFWGGHLWILAVALEFASMLMGGINFLTTTMTMRAKGMSFFRMPLLVWMLNIASLIFMFSVGPLIAGALMLLADRLLNTGFYLPSAGGDPLLFQHLFWFFGHPEVYVLLLPSLGILAEVFTVFSRKPLFGYKAIIYSTIVAGVLSFLVWAHHQFISGMDPRLAAPFSITTILISVPFAISVFAFIATLWRGSIQLSTPMLFALGMLAEFLVGGVTGIFNGSSAADIYLHDTYFVVAHFHYTLFPVTFLGAFAGIYHWYPKMFGRMMNETWGKVHFWVTTLSFNVIFLPLFALGLAGHQRRIFDPSYFDYLAKYQHLHVIASVALVVMLAGQIPFILNFFISMKKGSVADRNPWQATTLEWVASSPPGHGNFEREPVVCRGPYDYSLPGLKSRDWLSQTEGTV
ncbi:MAG: cbb3-type cytochrome c oxidase subunit I [Deltaproteobacteria bacterium]|nr:cbb3-type cytochrome c oxidase subunit I [Deltaproteobacteria bacterium]